MVKVTKEVLLNYVNEIGDNHKFWNELEYGKNKEKLKKVIGSTNIRSLAVTASNADCYKEMKLFIEYKMAKGNGWDAKFDKSNKFGDKIIEIMENIYKAVGEDDKIALEHISKFFGYLYWKKRIIGDK